MGPGGQLGQAVLRDYHFYGHAAAGRLAIERSLAAAMAPERERGREGLSKPPSLHTGTHNTGDGN